MRWHVSLGLIISTGIVVVIAYQVNIGQLVVALQSAQFVFLIPVVLLHIVTLLIRAWRWRHLLEPVKTIGTLNLLSATSIGFMANMILPARVGEVIRACVIGEKEQVSKTASFATVVVDRVLDLLSLLLILVFLLVFVSFPLEMGQLAERFRMSGYLLAVVCLLFVGGLGLLSYRTVQTIKLMEICSSFLPRRWLIRIKEVLESFAFGLQAIKKGRHLVAILILSVCLWTAMALINLLTFLSFGLHLPFYAPFFFILVQSIGAMVPSSPGFIGTYHAAVVAGFAAFQISEEFALSVAIIMHACFVLPFILLGLVFLWKENLSFHELWSLKGRKFGGAML